MKLAEGAAICSIVRNLMSLVDQRTTRIGLIVLPAVLLFFWAAFFGKVFAARVTLTWSYDYGPMPACSATRTTNCIDHFEVLDITDQKETVTIQFASNAKEAVGKVDRISANFKYGPPFGHRTISVLAVARAQNGNRITSNPDAARLTVFIRPFFRLPT